MKKDTSDRLHLYRVKAKVMKKKTLLEPLNSYVQYLKICAVKRVEFFVKNRNFNRKYNRLCNNTTGKVCHNHGIR